MIALLYIGLIVVAFFFLIVLPQRRRMAAHQAMVASLVVGDDVITTGGIHGTIRSLDDEVVRLEIADGVLIRLARNAVAQKVVPERQVGGESTDETTTG
jgi:preprotein translocase subunit YajC